MKFACPHCGSKSFTIMNKMILGPARSIACKACGGTVSVSWASLVWTFVYLIVVSVLFVQLSETVAIPVLLVTFACWCLLYLKFVPLVKK